MVHHGRTHSFQTWPNTLKHSIHYSLAGDWQISSLLASHQKPAKIRWSGWRFGTCFPYIGKIIPTDIFFTMVETTNQWYKMIYWYTTLRFTQVDCNGLSPPLQGTYLFMGSTMAVMYFRLLQAWSTEKRYQFLKPYFHRYWATRIVAVIRNNMFLTYCFPKKHTDTIWHWHIWTSRHPKEQEPINARNTSIV